MKTENSKYDDMDIEGLLMKKSFNELLSDEKAFVLEHMNSEEEYDSMRKMLTEIYSLKKSENLLEPPKSIRANLMAEFANEKKGSFKIWLNSLFAIPERPWYTQTGYRYAMMAAGICAGVIFVLNFNTTPMNIVELKPEKETQEQKSNSPGISSEGTISSRQITIPEPVESLHEQAIVHLDEVDEVKSVENYSDGTTALAPVVAETNKEEAAGKKTETVITTNEDIVSDYEKTMTTSPAAPAITLSEAATADDFSFDTRAGNSVDQVVSSKTKESLQSTKNKDLENKSTVRSINMSDKKELLDLLFTAL